MNTSINLPQLQNKMQEKNTVNSPGALLTEGKGVLVETDWMRSFVRKVKQYPLLEVNLACE